MIPMARPGMFEYNPAVLPAVVAIIILICAAVVIMAAVEPLRDRWRWWQIRREIRDTPQRRKP